MRVEYTIKLIRIGVNAMYIHSSNSAPGFVDFVHITDIHTRIQAQPTQETWSKIAESLDNIAKYSETITKKGWLETYQPIIVAFIMLASFAVAWRGIWLTRHASRVEVFRNLRDIFSKLRRRLPDSFHRSRVIPDDADQIAAMVSYWQLAFDEWMITNKLSPYLRGYLWNLYYWKYPKKRKDLWNIYYKGAIIRTCESSAMIACFFKAAESAPTLVDGEFVKLILSNEFTRKNDIEEALSLMKSTNIDNGRVHRLKFVISESQRKLLSCRDISVPPELLPSLDQTQFLTRTPKATLEGECLELITKLASLQREIRELS